MISGFENIKLIYKELQYTSDYELKNMLEIDFEEFVATMYDKFVETKYNGHEKFAIHGLRITSLELKNLILDTIFSNLFCEFILMLQNIDQGNCRVKHEIFLTSIELNKNLNINVSQMCKERFRRRMQSNRLNLIKKVKIKSSDKTSFYSPALLRAFKETLLIARTNTEIFDISKNYADIFYSLMFNSDEDEISGIFKSSRETIRSHRIWKLTPNDSLYILNLVQNVLDNNHNGNQVVQMMLLEKLFGLYTISDLWEFAISDNFDDFSNTLIYALSVMRRFGYCLLHQRLIYTILSEENRNTMNVKNVVDRYIYPICKDMLKKILKTVLKSLEMYDDEQCVYIINNLIDVCQKNRTVVFTNDINDTLMEIPPEILVELIKGMNGFKISNDSWDDFFLQLLRIIKMDDSEGMKKYLKNFSRKSYNNQFYDPKYKNIDYNLLFDVSFYDLTFTEKHTISKYEQNKILNPNSKINKK